MRSAIVFIVVTMASIQLLAQTGPGKMGPQLTQKQQECLSNKIGKPNRGERPDMSKMQAAFSECGIEMPKMNPADKEKMDEERISQLEDAYKKSTDVEQKSQLREHMKRIYQMSSNDDIKSRIRTFFKNNPDSSGSLAKPLSETPTTSGNR